jgi:hypothetical protein
VRPESALPPERLRVVLMLSSPLCSRATAVTTVWRSPTYHHSSLSPSSSLMVGCRCGCYRASVRCYRRRHQCWRTKIPVQPLGSTLGQATLGPRGNRSSTPVVTGCQHPGSGKQLSGCTLPRNGVGTEASPTPQGHIGMHVGC